ncbi:MAG TPA: alpha/beta hydrolase [Caulobacteraceae bacterium]|nr:alpha/beta hydrolase [Caulobacteraceae bacterium]
MGRGKLIFAGIVAVVVIVLVGGFALLQRPDIPYATLQAKYANAQSRFMDLPGGLHVHYRDQGNPAGPPLVMVHGFSASLQAWEPWVAILTPDYRIVTLDLPGHGLTRAPAGYKATIDRYADLTDDLAQRLKLGRYVAVGNSMGGGVAWDLALRRPSHLRGLVLVDSAGLSHRGRRGDGPLIFRLMRNPVGRALLRNLDSRPLIESGLKAAYVDPRLVTPALVDRYADLARAPGHRDILLSIQGGDEGASAATLAGIHTPTLVMVGEKDALIPPADGKALAAAIPGAKLVVYPDAGHVPMEQIPARSAADLKSFLQNLPASPTA